MSKVLISQSDWVKFEEVLKDFRIGYSVIFDDHHGTAEMVIDIQTIGVYRQDNKKEEVSI